MATRAKGRTKGMAAASLAAAAIAAAGCGGGDSTPKQSPSQQRGRPPSAAPKADRARAQDVTIIRSWSDSLRGGRVAAAARYFAHPVIVENNAPPLRLHTSSAVREFNSLLPCGAKLLEARRIGRYTVATFRLTGRPGGDCRTGVGKKAATAFRFRGHKISEWRRVALPSEVIPEPGPGPGVPPPEQV
jgi:hypothetical protein